MPVYTPGKLVWHIDRHCIVENILISKGRILIKFKDKIDLVDSEDTYCAPTTFEYKKTTS